LQPTKRVQCGRTSMFLADRRITAFAVAVMPSAQAMPLALPQPRTASSLQSEMHAARGECELWCRAIAVGLLICFLVWLLASFLITEDDMQDSPRGIRGAARHEGWDALKDELPPKDKLRA